MSGKRVLSLGGGFGGVTSFAGRMPVRKDP
jgi:hypothetical protein